MDQEFDKKLRQTYLEQLKQKNKTHLSYGTSGFRERAEILPFIAYRLGIHLGQKSKLTPGKVHGIVITASHNPIYDNGFKLVPIFGGMVSRDEEILLENLMQQENINFQYDQNGVVYIGRDTRPSSVELLENVIKGIQQTGAQIKDFGLTTTPQLYFEVWSKNSDSISYVDYICEKYRKLVQNPIQGQLILDCAEGVTGVTIPQFIERLKDIINIKTINDGKEPQMLNDQCGSEHVQKNKQLPKEFQLYPKTRYASVDGDGDRLIYYQYKDNKIHLIEGDRIAILFAEFIKERIPHIEIGIIQTAYANGSSTKYITEVIGAKARFEPTGVKYLHKAAHEFDIGLYFEANGHGSILYKNHVIEELKQKGDDLMINFLKLSNPAVGDSIANILLIEYILSTKNLTIDDWLNKYQDYETISTKIYCSNKNIIKTNYEETEVVEPIQLSQQISEVVSRYPSYRVCVRPSGTEDLVRVHAEGPQLNVVQQLNEEILKILNSYLA